MTWNNVKNWLKKYVWFPIALIILFFTFFVFKSKSEKKIDEYLNKNSKNISDDKKKTNELRKQEQEEKLKVISEYRDKLAEAEKKKNESLTKIDEQKQENIEEYKSKSTDELASVFAKKYKLKKGE